MPLVTRDFEIPRPTEDLWKIMNDPVALGQCIPGCEKVTVLDPQTTRWNLKIVVGVISRKLDARARVIASNEDSKALAIKFDTTDGDITGEFRIGVAPAPAGNSSKLSFSANIEARGPFQWMVNQIIKNQLDKFSADFVKCISG